MNYQLKTSFNDIVYYDGWYYGASNTHNGLYKFNSSCFEFICLIPTSEQLSNMFIETRLIRDKIYFIPSTSNYIVIYYLKDSTFIIKPLKSHL